MAVELTRQTGNEDGTGNISGVLSCRVVVLGYDVDIVPFGCVRRTTVSEEKSFTIRSRPGKLLVSPPPLSVSGGGPLIDKK